MPDFIVKLDGIKLSKAAEASIAREIQAAALRELAKIDTGGDFHLRIPKKWWVGLVAATKALPKPEVSLEVNERLMR